jgi:hypothetical protein
MKVCKIDVDVCAVSQRVRCGGGPADCELFDGSPLSWTMSATVKS